MSALLELIREAPPEDREAAAKLLRPYLVFEKKKQQPERLLSVKEFQSRMPVKKRTDWIRNDMFIQNPELKQFAFGLNAGKGHPLKISPRALTWIAKHQDDIDWRG
ncbi:hypothetical protein [Limosilactobacillus caecicola]|uniref:hypothetical protein n=1 Tax=Limosilactobacillus caecicola TaxID=2941332 RepID=UPI00203A5EB6|nr:hypothetical protein [Limosilactobacillus caecicola]